MYPSDPRIAFAILRQNHYVAGRIALFSGQLQPAAMLLGYALEFSLKAAAAGVDGKQLPSPLKKQLHKHDLPELLAETVAAGLLPAMNVSAEFWEFASDHLNQRYPIQQRAVHERQQALGRLAVMSISHVECYDDVMMQLDDALTAQHGRSVSIVGRAANDIDNFSTRAMLHCNASAMRRLAAAGVTGDRVTELWTFSAMPSALARPYAECEVAVAGSFRYPTPVVTTEDGKLKVVVPIIDPDHPVSTTSVHALSIGGLVWGPDMFLPDDDQHKK